MNSQEFHNASTIDEVAKWLRAQADYLPFGQIELTLHMHKGLITRIERGSSESVSIVSKKKNERTEGVI